jgi:hypothetical protein
MHMMDLIKLIRSCAEIPSFSTHEDRLLSFIEKSMSVEKDIIIEHIPDNNLIIMVPGKKSLAPLALTAHLDKIDHFGDAWGETMLPFSETKDKIKGQLDDAVGIGICLSMIDIRKSYDTAPLYILLSEMEEQGQYEKQDGSMFFSGIGSFRISQYIMDRLQVPGMFITIDTSPQFKGKEGVAVYNRYWEKCSLKPEEYLIKRIEIIERYIKEKFPFTYLTNGSNDYVNYGMLFNTNHDDPVPSIALEPAIFPNHQKGEEMFISDIEKVIVILNELLVSYSDGRLA